METVSQILNERGKRYGLFSNHAKISQSFKEIMVIALDQSEVDIAPDQREALEMIFHKIARIINGDPDYADSWVDVAGYAMLVADRLNGVER